MKSKKLFVYIIVLAIIAIALLIVGKKNRWFGKGLTIKVAVEKAERRDIIEIITSNGKVQPQMEVKLSPDVSGEIIELKVKEGDIVKKGDLILKIKPDNYISARNRVEATLNNTKARQKQTEAQLAQSKLEYDRKLRLWNQKAISEAEYEQALTAYNSAKAEKEAAAFSVQSAEASLKEAEENLRKTTIYAPISGTISRLEVEPGERVVGTELMTGTSLLRIADMDKMEVLVEVNENDIVRVHLMDTAFIEIDAYPEKKFTGVVTEIPVSANITGTNTDQVANFNVKIQMLKESYSNLITERNPHPLRPGMSATASIQTSKKFNVISVPVQAVTVRPDTVQKIIDKTYISENPDHVVSSGKEQIVVVFLTKNNQAVLTKVESGIQDDQYIEIISGVEEGEEIITAPYSAVSKKLENNNNIEIVEMKDLFGNNKRK